MTVRSGLSQTTMRRRLGELVELHRHLLEAFSTTEAARSRLRHRVRFLAGLAPAETLRAGRVDRVETALEALASGIFV